MRYGRLMASLAIGSEKRFDLSREAYFANFDDRFIRQGALARSGETDQSDYGGNAIETHKCLSMRFSRLWWQQLATSNSTEKVFEAGIGNLGLTEGGQANQLW